MAHITRREFASTIVASTALSAMTHSFQPVTDYPLAFSTLGCPKWEWKKILAVAAENGYSGIELRGIQGEMDLTKRPEFIGAQLASSLKDLSH